MGNYNQTNKQSCLKTINGVRVRFSPSPTGALHIGGVRTALYNYLFAKKLGGKFILRIEDTDSTRFVKGAEQYIKDSFDWLGIKFDEGPGIGGSFSPYRQSERKDLYYDYAIRLVNEGKAYFAFDTADDLDKARTDIPNFCYGANTRMNMRNSLTMSHAEVNNIMKTSQNFVIRIKYPDTPVDIKFNDMIRGDISINTGTLDDKVIWKKKDELPTYHLANVVDDYLMQISHVIRGEEWIPSTPLHVYLYDSFGWDKPIFAHLPLILGPNGKLSKRDGDKFGFPVYPLEWIDPKTKEVSSGYKSMGYTPEAVINILAFLGWNPGTNKEIYSLDELINDFDISRVNKAGAKFNLSKAAWFNGQHLKNTSTKDLLDVFFKELDDRKISMTVDNATKIIDANKNKINFVQDIFTEASYLFEKPTDFDPKGLKKWNINKSPEIIHSLWVTFRDTKDWTESVIQKEFEEFVKFFKLKFGEVALPLRLMLTGKSNGPSMFEIMELIGQKETMKRLENFNYLSTLVVNKKTITDVVSQDVIKIRKEFDSVSKALSGSEKKLSNPNFVNNAPVDVVENEKKKMDDLTIKFNDLKGKLDEINT